MWKKEQTKKHTKKGLILLAILLVISGIGGFVFLKNDDSADPSDLDMRASALVDFGKTEVTQSDDTSDETEVPEPLPLFDTAELKKTLINWDNALSGVASVVVLDENGTELASINKDRSYFAASIYKLYVAYFGYQKIDAGLADPDEQYINGHTRMECLDLMIRESDSPCAEKMWVELGKQNLTDQLVELGVVGTSMTNIRTRADNAAAMLALISQGEGLSQASQQAFLESAEGQVYRDSLNKGFSDRVTVYNKIGFRDLIEYHDVAIIETSDGRRFILAVLTEQVGTRNIASLGTRIEGIIQN